MKWTMKIMVDLDNGLDNFDGKVVVDDVDDEDDYLEADEGEVGNDCTLVSSGEDVLSVDYFVIE